MPYRYRDSDAVATLVVLTVVGVGLLCFWSFRAIVAGIRESAAIHAEYAGTNTRTERVLKWTLAGFLGALGLAALLGGLLPATAGLDVTVACWAFLTYAVVVAVAGWRARRAPQRTPVLDDYLDFSTRSA